MYNLEQVETALCLFESYLGSDLEVIQEVQENIGIAGHC